MRSVALFADIGNLFHCIGKKYEGRRLDYEKLIKKATGRDNMIRAFAYGGQIENEAQTFIQVLKRLGYEPKYKRPKQFEVEPGIKEFRRADWDVGIAIDVVRYVDKVQVIYLATSDGDMAPLVEWVQQRGCKCIIIACGISRELRDIAECCIEIDESLLSKIKIKSSQEK